MLKYSDIRKNEKIITYIRKADESLNVMGFTEHSFVHVTKVAETARYILKTIGLNEHMCELAAIAGFMHDIGNVVNRTDHATHGAIIAFKLLEDMGADPEDIATIITAIGNHDESTAFPVNAVAAALILADKCDVRSTRVRNLDFATYDQHDRVNYAVKESIIDIEKGSHIHLRLTVDLDMCSVMDYFEIFLGRMLLCRKAAEKLGLEFRMSINGEKVI